MINKRAALFEDDDIDISGFGLRSKSQTDHPAKDEVREVSKQAGFTSREAIEANNLPSHDLSTANLSKRTKKRPYNSSENQKVQLNIRVSQDVVDSFYKITKDNEWTLGQTLRKALIALEKSINEKN